MTTLYQQQLEYIFNRPTGEPEWYWQNDANSLPSGGLGGDNYPFDEDVCTFFEHLFKNPKTDLAIYNDEQIGLGLNFIFNNACSNLCNDFQTEDVPFERKINILKGIENLFADIFNPRCEQICSAGSQRALSKINYVCYMFWDITSLSVWNGLDQNKTEIYNKTIANIMKTSLHLTNPACVESGLHGLGHLTLHHAEIAVPIIDKYLQNKKNKNQSLINYAQAARTGMIQ
ncbi:MAG: hypothetical protein RL757_2520 [Bacteroidota bacterium]|jgi:hypothetical protein